MITYKKIIEIFKEIADNHGEIKQFGNGVLEDVNTSMGSGLFPYLWITPQSVKLGANSMVYTIRVMVFDINDKSETYTDEILSTTILILNDVLIRLNNDSNDYSVIGEPIATPFVQQFSENTVGWFTDYEIEVATINSTCRTA